MVEPIQVDESLWPLVQVRLAGVVTDAHLVEFFARMSAVLQRGEPFVGISDTTRINGTPPATQRQIQAEWFKKHEAALRKLSLGQATIITSPLIRLVTSLAMHLRPAPFPRVVVPDFPTALAWVLDRLRQAGRAADAERIQRHFDSRAGTGTG